MLILTHFWLSVVYKKYWRIGQPRPCYIIYVLFWCSAVFYSALPLPCRFDVAWVCCVQYCRRACLSPYCFDARRFVPCCFVPCCLLALHTWLLSDVFRKARVLLISSFSQTMYLKCAPGRIAFFCVFFFVSIYISACSLLFKYFLDHFRFLPSASISTYYFLTPRLSTP